MLRKTLLLSMVQLLALGTAVSIPSPMVGDPAAEADRAEVAGIMYTSFSAEEHYYLFVTNEYSGDELLRQSFCDIYADSRQELLEGALCRNYWQIPKFEGELSLEKLRVFKHYKHTNRYNSEGEGAVVFRDMEMDEGVRTSEATLGIMMSSVRSVKSFKFSVWSDPRERITSAVINVAANHWTCEEDELTGDNDCLWTPPDSVSRQITPYQWYPESSFETTDLRDESGFRGLELASDDYEQTQREFENPGSDYDYGATPVDY